MNTLKTLFMSLSVTVIICFVAVLLGCRSVPCSSIDALSASFDVFWQDHTDMLQRDETLTTEDKQVVFDHALTHKRLIEELEKLCGGE